MQGAKKQVWVLGASGYSGAELCRLVQSHSQLQLTAAFVSATSPATALSALYPNLATRVEVNLQPFDGAVLQQAQASNKLPHIVCMALPHEASIEWARAFVDAGVCVVDLSAAMRLADMNNYLDYYGFSHPDPDLVAQAQYVIPELCKTDLSSTQLLAMAGCYPTAATLALYPLQQAAVLSSQQQPVISAVSGVSGAGRGAQLNTSFCEVSLRPYAVASHRHIPEIEQNLGQTVFFTPHLGNFKRGIVASCHVRVKAQVDSEQVNSIFQQFYRKAPLVRLKQHPPSVDDVAHTPFCDLHWAMRGDQLVVTSAIDNLLKGAAAQAIQAINLKYGWAQAEGLL